jgi:hypothetical protein
MAHAFKLSADGCRPRVPLVIVVQGNLVGAV